MLRISPESHLDHGLSPAHVDWIVATFADRTGFFVATVELPSELSPLLSGLHGPLAGDAPVPDAECRLVVRGTRAGASRLCDRALRATRTTTVVAGPSGDEPCVLYTVYGGPAAPREPWDPSLSADVSAWRASGSGQSTRSLPDDG